MKYSANSEEPVNVMKIFGPGDMNFSLLLNYKLTDYIAMTWLRTLIK